VGLKIYLKTLEFQLPY